MPDLTPTELDYVGNIFKARTRINELDIDSPVVDRNLKMRLMLTMQLVNKRHNGYTSPNQTFVCPQIVVSQFYHNVAKRIDKKMSSVNGKGSYREDGLRALDLFRRQNLNIKNRLTEGENFANIDRKTGLIKPVSTDELNKNYDQEWYYFATTFPHNDYQDDVLAAKASLTQALNDPGDTDLDGNTLTPAGTSARLENAENPRVVDLNGDGTIDTRDYDLVDGRLDHPENFETDELKNLAEEFGISLADIADEVDDHDFDMDLF